MKRKIAFLAMVSPLWFAVVYLASSAARPEYSHRTKAISELGSVDAPRAWVWNLFGYIIPGCIVALLGRGIGNRLRMAEVLGSHRARSSLRAYSWLCPASSQATSITASR